MSGVAEGASGLWEWSYHVGLGACLRVGISWGQVEWRRLRVEARALLTPT